MKSSHPKTPVRNWAGMNADVTIVRMYTTCCKWRNVRVSGKKNRGGGGAAHTPVRIMFRRERTGRLATKLISWFSWQSPLRGCWCFRTCVRICRERCLDASAAKGTTAVSTATSALPTATSAVPTSTAAGKRRVAAVANATAHHSLN